jgi:membrane protein
MVRLLRSDEFGILAAALAYNFFLALFPFAIFVTAVSGAVARLFGVPNVSEQMLALLGQLPAPVSELLAHELTTMMETETSSLLSFSALSTLWFATSGTRTLMVAMDRAYGATTQRGSLARLLAAAGLTVLAGSALVLTFLLLVAMNVFGAGLLEVAGVSEMMQALTVYAVWPAAGLLVFAASTVVYRVGPSLELSWWRVLPGAAVFTAGWLVATAGFSFYVTRFGRYSITYGTLAGVAVLLIWFYLTSYLLLAGVLLNVTLEQRAKAR